MKIKRWLHDREPTVDEVVAAIAQTASELRREADKATASQLSMDEIAARLETLVVRLRDPDEA